MQTAPATLTLSETCASVSPLANGDGHMCPAYLNGAVLRTHIKALCPSKEDDAEAKAICDRASTTAGMWRAVWGARLSGPRQEQSPVTAGQGQEGAGHHPPAWPTVSSLLPRQAPGSPSPQSLRASVQSQLQLGEGPGWPCCTVSCPERKTRPLSGLAFALEQIPPYKTGPPASVGQPPDLHLSLTPFPRPAAHGLRRENRVTCLALVATAGSEPVGQGVSLCVSADPHPYRRALFSF